MFISYAQNFEDVMLWRALKNVEKGFYIDIGAQDPVNDSVSFAFYENGWRGVHVEPVPYYADKLRQARPDETVIHAAVARNSGVLSFFEVEGTGLSTADPQIAEKHRIAGYNIRKTVVPCLPLFEILERYKDRDIHWMKIDVEGMEAEVLHGWQSSSVRPWIVVVESILPNTQVETHGEWESLLTVLGYDFVYFDGLNRFYVSKVHQELKEHFRCPPNFFDYFTLSGKMSASFCVLLNSKLQQSREEIQRLRDTLTVWDKKIKELQADVKSLSIERDEAKASVAAANKRVHELEISLAQRDSARHELQDQIKWLKVEWEANKAKIQELNDQVHHWWAVADGFNRKLQSVYASRTWCLTRPLRLMKPNSNRIFRSVKSLLVYTVSLPRQIVRRFLEAGLTYMRRNPRHKNRLKRILERWPWLQARLYAFASARPPKKTVEIPPAQSSTDDDKFDLSTYPVSVRTIYRQLRVARSRVDPKREKGESI